MDPVQSPSLARANEIQLIKPATVDSSAKMEDWSTQPKRGRT